jgi:hypothetical protein
MNLVAHFYNMAYICLFIMKSKVVLVHDTMAYVYYMEICQLHAMLPLSPGKWSPVHNRFDDG